MEWLNKMEKVLSDYLGEKEKLLQENKQTNKQHLFVDLFTMSSTK